MERNAFQRQHWWVLRGYAIGKYAVQMVVVCGRLGWVARLVGQGELGGFEGGRQQILT